MKGLFINKKETPIGKVPYSKGCLELLCNFDDREVNLLKMDDNFGITFFPQSSVEFCYVVEGLLKADNNDEDIVLSSGDNFYTKCLTEPLRFRSIGDSKVIFITSEKTYHTEKQIRDTFDNKIKEIQAKDDYTADHCYRVTNLAEQIAISMNLSLKHRNNIAEAACCHDIGKINIPSSILNKNGKLTDEEYEIIKDHPTIGYKLVKDVLGEEVAKIVEQHHERLNGEGYPYGLKDDQISLEAKIIAVADSYDAMTSDRPYRKAMTSYAALEELNRHVGVHYQEDIVKKLEEILREEGRIK